MYLSLSVPFPSNFHQKVFEWPSVSAYSLFLNASLVCSRELRNKERCFLKLMDIQNWLQRPKVWKFVCFVSCVVGLLCFALSSCFNDLFGKWTTWKILLYTVFSFITCLVLSLVKAREAGSSSPWLKVNSAFLVLLSTSVYSHYFDKKVKVKPDAFSLLSSVAFATMSLGLSRISHFGFEVDLLYFFIGVLIAQLMNIKFWLVIVGGIFGYFLVFVLRSNLIFPLGIGLDTRLPSNQNHLVIDVDPNSSQAIVNVTGIVHPQAYATRDQIMTQFMGHIKELRKENRNVIDIISKNVDKYLKADVMNEDQIPVQEMEADDNLVADALPSEMIEHLRDTGWKMVVNGLEKEFYHMYTSFRKEFMKECLKAFGLKVDELNVDDVDKMENIESWIKALNVAVRILFPNERRLCDLVFQSSSNVFPSSLAAADFSLREVCKELNSHLLRFVKTLATENHSHLSHVIISKVFKTLSDLLPNFDSLFYGQLYSGSLRKEAVDIFEELKSLVPRDGVQADSQDNAVVRQQFGSQVQNLH